MKCSTIQHYLLWWISVVGAEDFFFGWQISPPTQITILVWKYEESWSHEQSYGQRSLTSETYKSPLHPSSFMSTRTVIQKELFYTSYQLFHVCKCDKFFRATSGFLSRSSDACFITLPRSLLQEQTPQKEDSPKTLVRLHFKKFVSWGKGFCTVRYLWCCN